MNEPALPCVLCVDDEPRVTAGLALILRRNYRVVTAAGGQAALDKILEIGAPAVVISDMRMPGMDGATFLKEIRRLYPETTRILLTGEPGRDAVVSAINEGQIFRFLTKPCAPEQVIAAVEAAVTYHRLITAEKTLLQDTLVGCIKALIDVLAITNPVAFGRSNRVKKLSMELAAAAGHARFWQLEAAAMLSQIGYISLPVELVEKLYYGEKLTRDEQTFAAGVPAVAQTLLGRIPRLEPVLEIVGSGQKASGAAAGGLITLGANILRLVLEYDTQLVRGSAPAIAVQTVRARIGRHDPQLLEYLASIVGAGSGKSEIIEIAVGKVQVGMVILDEVRTDMGTLLVPKGFEVTGVFIERMRNFGPGILAEIVRVSTNPAVPLPGAKAHAEPQEKAR
jgi:response regulator RpfG family c-di-GMP phosphodiesterase